MTHDSPDAAEAAKTQSPPESRNTPSMESGREAAARHSAELTQLRRNLDDRITRFLTRLDALKSGSAGLGTSAAPDLADAGIASPGENPGPDTQTAIARMTAPAHGVVDGQTDSEHESRPALKRSLEQRFEELGKLTRILANCEQELEATNRDLLYHRIALQTARKSLSWRITAPLRSIAGVVRRWRDWRGGGDAALIRDSELFDTAWYLARYPDVALSGMDAFRHYLEIGAREGRDPSVEFDTDWYLERNPDVVHAGMNPLVHYIRHGEAEWRLPKP